MFKKYLFFFLRKHNYAVLENFIKFNFKDVILKKNCIRILDLCKLRKSTRNNYEKLKFSTGKY